jgi:hypothetical protein
VPARAGADDAVVAPLVDREVHVPVAAAVVQPAFRAVESRDVPQRPADLSYGDRIDTPLLDQRLSCVQDIAPCPRARPCRESGSGPASPRRQVPRAAAARCPRCRPHGPRALSRRSRRTPRTGSWQPSLPVPGPRTGSSPRPPPRARYPKDPPARHPAPAAHGPGRRCPCREPHPCSSCRMLILMGHSAESVPSSYVKAGELVRSCQRCGQWLERAGVGDALVRPVSVVELLELL